MESFWLLSSSSFVASSSVVSSPPSSSEVPFSLLLLRRRRRRRSPPPSLVAPEISPEEEGGRGKEESEWVSRCEECGADIEKTATVRIGEIISRAVNERRQLYDDKREEWWKEERVAKCELSLFLREEVEEVIYQRQ